MNILNSYTSSPTFKSRCIQIRDAQWVCHKINTEMPHYSISKIKPMIVKQMNKLEQHFPKREKTSVSTESLNNNFTAIILNNEDSSQLPLLQHLFIKFRQNFYYTEKDKQISRILNKVRLLIREFNQKRNECKQCDNDITNSLIMLEKYRFGNCKETANLAELILRMNGIKNAKTVMLKAENENVTLDHAICVFNRDGSTFSKIKRDTIVVDPWANKADFAGNMIKYYKNQCNKFFRIPKNKKIVFFQYKCNKLNETDLLKFRETYPNFIFNNSKRKFMNE